MAGKKELALRELLSSENDAKVQLMYTELCGYIAGKVKDGKLKSRAAIAGNVRALLNNDRIMASMELNDEKKEMFLENVSLLKKAITRACVGHRLEKENVKNGDIAKEASIMLDEANFAYNGSFNANSQEIIMDEEAKNAELARKFGQIIEECDDYRTPMERFKASAVAIRMALGMKVKEISSKWKELLAKRENKTSKEYVSMREKLEITPSPSLVMK